MRLGTLESQTVNVIKQMLTGQDFVDVSKTQQRKLARLVVAKEMVLEYSGDPSGAANYYTRAEREDLFQRNIIPVQTWVWVTMYADPERPVAGLANLAANSHPRLALLGTGIGVRAYAAVYSIGRLMFLVFSRRGGRNWWVETDFDQSVLRIWPPIKGDLSWPPREESEEGLEAFMFNDVSVGNWLWQWGTRRLMASPPALSDTVTGHLGPPTSGAI